MSGEPGNSQNPSPNPAVQGGGRSSPPAGRIAEEIQEWIINHVARSNSVLPAKVNVTAPFEDLAVDSATAIGMTGELQDWLGKRVDPTWLYDYPTNETFSAHLADETYERFPH